MDLLLEQIKSIRKAKGYTQKEFATKLRLSHTHYCAIEKGRNKLTLDVLNKIAVVTNTMLIITFVSK